MSAGELVVKDNQSGNTARVVDGGLNTNATTLSKQLQKSLSGDTFAVATSDVNLTTDNESFLLYIVNNEQFNWVETNE